MIVTNEPGVYREGEYGIRTENTMRAVDYIENVFGRFMRFETFSYCPIDLDGIDADMLTADEVEWLNGYHDTVYRKLAPVLSAEERGWLAEAARKI